MTDMQSFRSSKPIIGRVTFRRNGFMAVELEDGRIVYVPLSNFPGIANLTPNQRRKHSIIDDSILMFRDDDEVYHIQDFLGTYETNAYQSPGKQQARALVDA